MSNGLFSELFITEPEAPKMVQATDFTTVQKGQEATLQATVGMYNAAFGGCVVTQDASGNMKVGRIVK